MRRFLSPFAILAGLGAVLLAAPAAAQQGPQCGPRDAIVASLADGYQEQVVSRAVTSTGALLEVLTAPSGSWSILVTVPGGPTCLVSSGEGYRAIEPGTTDPKV